ncbi:MAG: molybdopterin molybdotransferase MoeA [Rhodocyclaceae bacterium]|jgi:molybdopterin molybdotransferase|nr:molybdopterin molybdotransferase MoeA [Rhodocyclaceae bacterium]
MLSYEEALDHLIAAAVPVAETKAVPLAAARGRILAAAQASTLDVPPLDNSAMDGYALRCADVPAEGTTLPVSQRIPAGTVGQSLQPGTAARIFTGAPVPAGADAVVMQELCEVGEVGAGGTVVVNQVPRPGQNIRRAGEDIAADAEILSAGVRLGPAELGLAASAGLATLPVFRRLRVALLSTGDELAEPGQPLPPGGIYNSNRYFLHALLDGLGCAVTDLGRVPDTLEATRAALQKAAEGNDLILSTGGVSVGEEDHVKAAIEQAGELNLWKIAIKPGKPLAFGRVGKVGAGGTAGETSQADFIGLPGNPVSSFVTFLMLVRPFILKRMGASAWRPPVRRLMSASNWMKPDKRREFLRARITPEGKAELYPHQGSGVLTSCAWADGLIDNLPGQSFFAGDTVGFIAFSDLF